MEYLVWRQVLFDVFQFCLRWDGGCQESSAMAGPVAAVLEVN